MKRAGLVAILALCTLPAAHGEQTLSINVMHALTPIDAMPTKEALIQVFPVNTALELSQIAQNPAPDLFGVRLRAIRALPLFCPTACEGAIPHATLVALITGPLPDAPSGQNVLLQRAAIEALGVARTGDPDDATLLVPFLDSQNRDVRAATARALRDMCSTQAIVPLRTRYLNEEVPQVRLAISTALRDLGQCSQ